MAANRSESYIAGSTLWAAGLIMILACVGCRERHGVQGSGGQVHGYVYVPMKGSDGGQEQIFLPEASVYLKNSESSAVSPKVVTNARGWFSTARVAAGVYELCWEAEGFGSGCSPNKIVIESSTVTPPPLEVRPNTSVLRGRITYPNFAPCGLALPMFGLDGATRVQLIGADGKSVGREVLVNSTGHFLLPAANSGQLRLRATCDGMTLERSLAATDQPVSLTFENRGPKILSVRAERAERPLHNASPGQKVQVNVSVRDTSVKRLHYRWFSSAQGGEIKAEDRPSITWTLPDSKGLQTLWVLVQAENGGRSVGHVDISTGGPQVYFSGTVTSGAGQAIAGAGVTINGHPTTTNAVGYFFLELPQQSARYIVNIAKPGYALFSRVMFDDFTAVTFRLIPSQTFPVDPAKPFDVPQAASTAHAAGISLHIDPNSLVDQNGHAPKGPLFVAISTYDLADPAGQVPGNFGGVKGAGTHVRTNTLGGGDVQIRDASGNLYNLQKGKTASVRIPIDPRIDRAQTLPSSLPLLFYDTAQGVWKEEVTAHRSGNFYEARVPHFSAISVGLVANNAACMRLNFDPGTVNFSGLVLNVTVPNGITGVPQLFALPVTNASTNVLAELPPNEPITLQLNSIELTKQVVNSGAAVSGPSSNPSPASCNSDAYLTVAPNDALGFDTNNPLFSPGGFLDYFGLDDQFSADAYYAAIDPTSVAGIGTVTATGAVVTGAGTNFLTFFHKGDIIRAASQVRTIAHVTSDTQLETFTAAGVTPPNITSPNAYERVGAKTTLNDFKTQNGFSGMDDASAIYFNAGDLGFGRSMHMWKSGSNIAYYVTNYVDVEAARLGVSPIATVAMDYSPNSLGGGPYTKFYVYDANGFRINNADLDQRGAKFIPRLCVICHAGQYVAPDSVNQGNMNSRFIAFDLSSYQYSGFNPSFGRASQEEEFRKLNQGVLESTNRSAAQADLITLWYGGPGGIDNSGTTQSDNVVPSGWTGAHQSLYTDVVRPSCRTCHVNRDHPLDWAKYSGTSIFADPSNSGFKQNGPTIEPYVCDIRFMPHSKVTYINFWANSSAAANPNRLNELRNGGLDNFLPTHACPAP